MIEWKNEQHEPIKCLYLCYTLIKIVFSLTSPEIDLKICSERCIKAYKHTQLPIVTEYNSLRQPILILCYWWNFRSLCLFLYIWITIVFHRISNSIHSNMPKLNCKWMTIRRRIECSTIIQTLMCLWFYPAAMLTTMNIDSFPTKLRINRNKTPVSVFSRFPVENHKIQRWINYTTYNHYME